MVHRVAASHNCSEFLAYCIQGHIRLGNIDICNDYITLKTKLSYVINTAYMKHVTKPLTCSIYILVTKIQLQILLVYLMNLNWFIQLLLVYLMNLNWFKQ